VYTSSTALLPTRTREPEDVKSMRGGGLARHQPLHCAQLASKVACAVPRAFVQGLCAKLDLLEQGWLKLLQCRRPPGARSKARDGKASSKRRHSNKHEEHDEEVPRC